MPDSLVPKSCPVVSPFLLRAADRLAAECWRAVEQHRVDARSPIGDAVLDYREVREDPKYPHAGQVTDEMVDRARRWELSQIGRRTAPHLAEWWRAALTAALSTGEEGA